MQLVLDTPGLHLSRKEKVFHLKIGDKSKTISPAKLSSIAITANITITSGAISLSLKHQIPILIFDRIGKAQARLWSPYFESIATLRRMQARFTEHPESTAWMIALFELKAQGQIDNLKTLNQRKLFFKSELEAAIDAIQRHQREFESFSEQIPDECRQQMMGVEGNIARIYWQALGSALPAAYRFQNRSKRPAKDHYNAAINYLYGMLYTVVEGALFAAGLDPHLGIFHADEYNKPTLVFDLIEPFRPWMDRLLINQCLQEKLSETFFTKNQYGLFLNREGKAFIIPLFNDFLRSNRKFANQETSVKNQIYAMASRLSQRIRSTMT